MASRKGPNDTPAYAIRIPEDLWVGFGDAVEKKGTTRPAVVIEFIRWYMRDPKPRSPLPARPDTPTPRRFKQPVDET